MTKPKNPPAEWEERLPIMCLMHKNKRVPKLCDVCETIEIVRTLILEAEKRGYERGYEDGKYEDIEINEQRIRKEVIEELERWVKKEYKGGIDTRFLAKLKSLKI